MQEAERSYTTVKSLQLRKQVAGVAGELWRRRGIVWSRRLIEPAHDKAPGHEMDVVREGIRSVVGMCAYICLYLCQYVHMCLCTRVYV